MAVGLFGALLLALSSAVPAAAVAGFGDVPAGEFYAEAVQWMVDREMTDGTQPGCFSPASPTTRGQVATFIHRAKGQPAGGSEPFSDVRESDYFAEAVAWMVDAGITTGTSPTTFDPDRLVTRGEVATFLHRAEGLPAGGDPGFSDVDRNTFYADAVGWMVTSGITTGTSPTTFEPDRDVTRGEIATFLYRAAGEPAVALTAGVNCAATDNETALVAAEAYSLVLLNDLRVSLGADPLSRQGSMDLFARNWSETMDLTGNFAHSSGTYGENIAWWSAGSASPEQAAATLHQVWVESPGHYTNMIRESYSSVGIGFWQSDDGWHATHVFS